MTYSERYVQCKGKDMYEQPVLGGKGLEIKVVRQNSFERPEKCQYLCGKNRDMCCAAGTGQEKWGYCLHVRAI